MIDIPIWWFVLSIILSIAGIGAIIWFVVMLIRYIKEYKDFL